MSHPHRLCTVRNSAFTPYRTAWKKSLPSARALGYPDAYAKLTKGASVFTTEIANAIHNAIYAIRNAGLVSVIAA